ncbi:MAG: hypothetical protein ABEJ57_01025 [Halobacteriaceae archaeon]
MKVRWAGIDRNGEAVDLRDLEADAETVLAAVMDPEDDRIVCRHPGPVVGRLGVLHRGMTVTVRTALATALRTRRVETPVDHALARAEHALANVTVPSVEVESARADLAEASADEAALRERVARLGGRVEALRDQGAEAAATAAASELEAAIASLSEVETDRVAAEQRLAQRRDEARRARDVRERRRRLADRVDNRRRDARDWLVETGHERFRAAVEAVPGPDEVGERPGSWDGPSWVAALAILTIAASSGPAVLGADLGFETADDARDVLEMPTILVEV